MTVVLIESLSDRAKQFVDNLQPDTLCSFNPDPAEQPDARWSAICSDEDMESNVRYAVATPGILRLWPWVNQVRRLHPRLRSDIFVYHYTRIRRPSRSPPKCPSRLSCRYLNAWGMWLQHTRTPRYPLSHPFRSPRVILVEDLGTLVGLTSVKDVLHLEPHEQLNSPIVAWSNRGALDGALEELWTWLADVRSSINAWYSRVSSRWR